MVLCYIRFKAEPSGVGLRAHLLRHKVIGELVYPILCCHCNSSFANIYNLIRHSDKFHAISSDSTYGASALQSGGSTDENTDLAEDDSNGQVNNVADSINISEDIRAEGVALVASMRANSSIPYSVIPAMVESFNHMANSITSLVHTETTKCLLSAGASNEIVSAVKVQLERKLDELKNPLGFLSTRYLQDKYFDNHDLAVKPESVAFSTQLATHGGKSRYVYESFQYCSVQKTLESLMQNEAYVQALLQDEVHSDFLDNFSDGERFKVHPLFSDSTKLSIMLQLFYDGLGVTNPLRGSSVLHNVGVFFFTVKNLSQQHNSCFANVHLLALCYSQDLKKYGFDPLLDKFVAEVNFLTRVGFHGTFPVIGQCTVYASLCQVTCDNLASNGMLGFIESFSCDYFCTLCYATQAEIQFKFREELFERRTRAKYEEDISDLKNGKTSVKKNHVRGVKTECKLNEVDGYHLTENWSLDIMHVVLEGIVPFELGSILYKLCVVDECFNLDKLNHQLQLFWGKMTVDKTHRPLSLNKLEEPGHGSSPSMKAVQYWALLKCLPFSVGHLVLPSNKHWQFLLHLSHLVDLLFAPRFGRDMISYLKSVIEDHLATFVELFSNNGQVRLRPKHHLLVHLPSIILKSGPLVGMSCMRYEMKNAFFKRSAHVVCNFTNICQTLAYRHQQRALYSLLSSVHIHDKPIAVTYSSVAIATMPFCEELCVTLGLQANEHIAVSKQICVGSLKYNIGNCVVIDECELSGDAIFGRIYCFVSCVDNDDWQLVLERIETDEFSAHYHAYCVHDPIPVTYRVVALKDLIDHHPLHCHCTLVNGVTLKFIRLPYSIFKA